MKIQQLQNGAYIITLPRQIVLAKGWKKGDEVKTEINKEGNIVIKEK